jgi:hypothetical protein
VPPGLLRLGKVEDQAPPVALRFKSF